MSNGRAARDYVIRPKSLISIAIMPAVPTGGAVGTAERAKCLHACYITRGRFLGQVAMQECLRAQIIH
jgi:hypothetical protein